MAPFGDRRGGLPTIISLLDLRKSPLLFLSVTCLDAPLVAVAWQELFARALHLQLPEASRVALFLTAWLIYLADRLADSLILSPASKLSLRQRSVQRHRGAYIIALAVAAILEGATLPWLRHDVIRAGACLAGASLLYLVLNHFFSRLWRFVPVKEVLIGFLFAAGVTISLGATASRPLVVAAISFGSLCVLNCISIAVWETDLDRQQGRSSIATVCLGLSWLPLVGCSLLAATAMVTLFILPFGSIWSCIALSSALLALLNASRNFVGPDERTALADLVLLTPLLLM